MTQQPHPPRPYPPQPSAPQPSAPQPSPPQSSPPPYGQVGPPAGQTSEARAASILAHLSAPIAAVLSIGWLSLLGPLVVWMLYKDRDPVVRQAAAGAFNFTITFWLANLVAWALIITLVGAVVGIPLLVVSFLVAAWCHVHGAIRAANGQPYSYPFQLPVLR